MESLTKGSWGWLPIITPLAAYGVLVTSLGMAASINNQPFAMLLFWIGILLITLPVGIRLLHPTVGYREALALVILAGEMLFLISVLSGLPQNNPYDGYLHWRTAIDILTTQHLFAFNNLLPVSPYYPGLEIVTTSLVTLTGLSIFQAGSIVVFVARLIMVTSLFMLLYMLSGSPRAAGLGCLIYMGSSTFVFFDAQFAYESLSLPLAVFVLWGVMKRSTAPVEQHFSWVILVVFACAMVAITHHLMSYFLAAILLLWTGMAIIKNWKGKKEYVPYAIAIALLDFVVAWLMFVAEITVGYLAPYFGGTLTTLLRFITGYTGDRSLISTTQSSGLLSERLVGIASVLFLLIGLAVGLLVWWTSQRKNPSMQRPLAIVLVLVGIIYPSLPLLHLSNNTWEVSNRMASYIFIGLGYVIGVGLAIPNIRNWLAHLRRWAFVPALGVIICGGVIAGSHPATRLPGPYLVEADNRSVDPYGVSAANWARTYLGPSNRMAGDREQSVIMGSLGQQSMVFRSEEGINISPIFLKPKLENVDFQDIKALQIQYLVIDQRITQDAPLFGYYFESWEQQLVETEMPINPAILDKFDTMPEVSRIFDNGNVRIYDLKGINLVP
jgi:hypothetical protein